MSDTAQGAREWRFYIEDMTQFCEDVLSYTNGLECSAFIADKLIYDATLRKLQLIGQAATHVPNDVRSAHPSIPWREIVATRNRLAHSYLHISNEVIWSIVQSAVPDLLSSLRNLLSTMPNEVG